MVDISSFLTEGAQIPAGSAVKATTSQTVLPEWYTNYAMQMLSNQQAQMATPYAPYQGPRVAEFAPAQQQGFGMTQQAAGAYQPALTAATGATQAALQAPGALTAAQPLISQAGQSSVANIGEYMNPFNEQVVNRIGQLGARNLTENIMPGVEGRYIAAGQLGFGGRGPGMGTPSGMLTDTARAVRDTQEAVLAEQSKALQAGYSEAGALSAADLARRANLAQTVGGLQSGDVSQQLTGAQQLGGLGQMAQQLGLTGAQAVTGVGATQQGQAQQNLDLAYADFMRQQGYNQEQINNALATFKGVAPGVPTGSQEAGIVPSGQQAEYKPSTAATIGGALTGIGGILAGAKTGTALGNLLGV